MTTITEASRAVDFLVELHKLDASAAEVAQLARDYVEDWKTRFPPPSARAPSTKSSAKHHSKKAATAHDAEDTSLNDGERTEGDDE